MRLADNNKGFTLVEVLVALTVTALMLTAVYQTVSSASKAREKLALGNAQHHMARIVAERIGRELQSLLFVQTDERTRFNGGLGGGDFELLSFVSTASTPLSQESGLPARISYRLEVELGGDKTSYRLTRTEKGALALEEGRSYKLAEGLSAIEIGFLSNGSWNRRWDTQTAQNLPEAVSLSFTTGSGSGKEDFRTRWQINER